MVTKGFPIGRVIFFVTSNIHKFNEARRILATYRIASAMLKIETTEIQDDNIGNIAEASAFEAFEKSNLPLIVEDAGLFIRALKGFPGPYSSYVFRTIGNEGVLQLMEGLDDRRAQFRSTVAFCAPSFSSKCFQGVSKGKIAEEARGFSGFGFDPIFQPFGGSGKTFGEMSVDDKNLLSHRSRAFKKFAEWYRSVPRKAFKYR